MPLSDTQICNLALSRIGSTFILSLDEDTKEGRTCKALFPVVRDQLLEMAQWNFATKRITLSQNSSTPEYEYAYEYARPADMIRLIDVYPVSAYKVEGQKILSNQSTLQARYISRVTITGNFPPSFCRALALLLAAELATRISEDTEGSKKKASLLDEFYRIALPEAMKFDAHEGGDKQATIESDWASEGR